MHDAKVLANVFKRNKNVIDHQVAGLSHADSLLQPEVRGNCMNFVLGHILASRETVMELLGLPSLMTPEEVARYDYGANPVQEEDETVIRLERLLLLLAQSNDRIIHAVESLSAEELEREIESEESNSTLGQDLEFYGWHEAYHVGQTEYLRQLAGTDDKVI